jgi:RimJ/RimL family protein N-acetyltransferase
MHAEALSTVSLRRLRGGERQPVLDVFEGLGERSRRLRFLGPKPVLARHEVDHLVDVGCCGREAVAAVEVSTGRTVGIARFVREGEGSTTAEVAFEVVDAWHGRGVGARLASELGRLARSAGITHLRATVAHGNAPALALLRRLGRIVEARLEGGAAELLVELDGSVDDRAPARAA